MNDPSRPNAGSSQHGGASIAVFGILNVTPDSFSDGGRWVDTSAAIEHALAMVEAGAYAIDVGGESTRPGAQRIPAEVELERVLPVVRELGRQHVRVSIDTMNASTAAACTTFGASIINDVSGGLADPRMPDIARDRDVDFVVMHWRGGASVHPAHTDPVSEVVSELQVRVGQLVAAGLCPDRLIVDPGLGFAKDASDNWALLANIQTVTAQDQRVMVGHSRKRFLREAIVEDRDVDAATAMVSAFLGERGVWALRVHDVALTRTALSLDSLMRDAGSYRGNQR